MCSKISRLRALRLGVTAFILVIQLSAQHEDTTKAPVQAPVDGTTVVSPKTDTTQRYQIGPGDVLSIRIFGRPELASDAALVDAAGTVRMPMIQSDIKASCRTEAELSAAIAALYREYLRDPQVTVAVKEYNSRNVEVTGAVQRPGSFQLRRKVRLRELLTLAGGLAQNAGDIIQVAHDPDAPSCAAGAAAWATSPEGITTVSLAALQRGGAGGDPYIEPGDYIVVPEAKQAFVVGNVYKPSTLSLKEPIRLSQAIAMAGGKLPGSRDDVRLVRYGAGPQGEINVRIVNLKDLEKNRAEDPVLRAGDVVDVPVSNTKVFAKTLLSSIATTSLYYPLVVVH